MLILYNLSNRDIIGVAGIFSDTSGELIEPTLKGSFPGQKIIPNIGGFTVPNDERIANELYRYELKFNASGEPIEISPKQPQPHLELSTDIPDRDRNGIPELKADGKSKATITASIRDSTGKLITNANNDVHFETTGGVILKRLVKCKNGVAKTTLQSVHETITPKITAYSESCKKGTIKIEFIHPSAKL